MYVDVSAGADVADDADGALLTVWLLVLMLMMRLMLRLLRWC